MLLPSMKLNLGVDCHCHCFPDSVSEAAAAAIQEGYPGSLVAEPRLEALLAGLVEAELVAGVIVSIATRPSQVENIARWAAGINKASKLLEALGQGRIPSQTDFEQPEAIALGGLHPASTTKAADVALLRALGLPGVKFQPRFQQYDADSEEAIELYKLIQKDFICVFHSGQEFPPMDPLPSEPRKLRHILDEAPDLLMVAAHTGGYQRWDDVERYLVGTACYFEVSFTFGELPDARLVDLLRAHGMDRVLFGTDWPLRNQRDYLARFMELPLTPDERDAVLWHNAVRLFSDVVKARKALQV